MRHAKIIATFGPATDSDETTRAIIRAGADVVRLNMSHGDHAVHETSYERVRRLSVEERRPVAIFADLQGPKIRLGRFTDGPHLLERGDRITITTRDVPGTRELVGTTHKGLPGDVAPGDVLLVDDGKVRLRAVEVTDTDVLAEVEVPGMVSDNKGINLPGVAVNVPALSEKDERDLRWALRTGVDMVALSFVRDAADVDRVHEIMDEEERRVPVIAKIEKPQAVENLEAIVDAFDAIMVARGDLGVELPLEDVPVVQKRAVDLARRWAKPVIVATQVLESMIDSPRPTRAEASDCANAVLDGADAVMLSGETSVGKYPIKTLETMSNIILDTETQGMDRMPPQDVDAERSVLGGMLLSKDAIADVVEEIQPGDFYKPAHQAIYDVILDLTRGETVFGSTTTVRFTATPGSSTFIDLVAPIGKGQRGLIVAPAKAGAQLGSRP